MSRWQFLTLHPVPATQIPPLSGRLAKASTILCVGEDAAGVARAAIGNVRQVHSSGDALWALACEDFVAVLLEPKMGQAAEQLATAFGRLIEFRPSPRWVVLKGPRWRRTATASARDCAGIAA